MIPILTPEEAGALDRGCAERGITVDALMERAGWAVARAAAALAGGTYGRRAVVVCGKGNNGGDGLVAARHLARWGMGVTVVGMWVPGAMCDAAGENLERLAEVDVRVRPYDAAGLRRELARADVAVDAIFGTGFHGEPEGDASEAIAAISGADAPVLAVDIPSGVEGATGAVRGTAVTADATATFGALKPGLVFLPGAALAGVVEVADIGFPPDLVRSDLVLTEAADVGALLAPRPSSAHKRSSGVVLVLAGSRAMTGAAVLAASAAYRAGAGLVSVAAPRSVVPVIQEHLVEATYLPLAETEDGAAAEEAFDAVAERLAGVDAAAFGPGLSRDPSTAALVRRLVVSSPVPFVLDADGLTAFAGGAAGLTVRESEAVLTPHAGEFARLTGVPADEVEHDRAGHARKAASEFRCAVLLKGPSTVIAEASGFTRVNPTGGPSLATGGTGDVLTGTIAAFLARGLGPADAAATGAFVQGLAGDLAGADLGEGTTATDVLDRLPDAIRAVRGR